MAQRASPPSRIQGAPIRLQNGMPYDLIVSALVDAAIVAADDPLSPWPIGSVFTENTDTNPTVHFGGTWQKIATGTGVNGGPLTITLA